MPGDQPPPTMAKHILRAAEFLRDLVARLAIEVRHLPGRVMVADLEPTF